MERGRGMSEQKRKTDHTPRNLWVRVKDEDGETGWLRVVTDPEKHFFEDGDVALNGWFPCCYIKRDAKQSVKKLLDESDTPEGREKLLEVLLEIPQHLATRNRRARKATVGEALAALLSIRDDLMEIRLMLDHRDREVR